MPTVGQRFVRITSRQPGFRRAGLRHPAGPIDHPAENFTAEQLAALEAEPRLQVEILELPADAAGESDAARPKTEAGGDGDGAAPAAPAAAEPSDGGSVGDAHAPLESGGRSAAGGEGAADPPTEPSPEPPPAADPPEPGDKTAVRRGGTRGKGKAAS